MVRVVAARDAQSLFVCARDTSVCCVQGSDPAENSFQVDPIVEPDVLNTSESSRERVCWSTAKCDTQVRVHQHASSFTFYITYNIKASSTFRCWKITFKKPGDYLF